MAVTTSQITITTMEGWYSGATPPLNPLIGDLWLDTTNNEIKKWDGTNWVKQADTQGPQGPKGDSIKFRDAYWIKSSDKPDKPTSETIGNWTPGSEPPETVLNNIGEKDKFWRVYKETYSNGESEYIKYSEVELIGSYEVLNGLVQFRNGVATTENIGGQDVTVIDGGKIKTGSIDAKKIHVEDLEALKATIGGFHVGKNSIYSGNKKTIDSTERGIYFDSNGQSYFGDDKNFIRFYRSDKENYKLQISADSLTFGSGVSVEKAFEDIKGDIQNAQNTANKAQSSADKAQGAADNAQSSADKAQNTANKAQTAINNLEIGGRNLVTNSINLSDFKIESSNYTTRVISEDCCIVNRLVNHINSGSKYGIYKDIRVTAGEEYTVSCTVKEITGSMQLGLGDANMWVGLGSWNLSVGRFTCTVTAPSSATFIRIYIFGNDGVNGGSVTVSNIKLEKGNKATDWTPAPEDIDAGITNAQTTADTAKTNAATAQTTADTAKANAATAQTAADTAKSKAEAINSKGEQLVINGNAILGNNTNFTQWLYDGSMANGSGGSFTLSPGTRKIIINDEFFGLDPLKDYRFEFDAISKESTSKHYSMLVFYDVDKKEIMALNHKYISEVTELAVDLKNGDTVVHLNDISSFNTNTGTRSYERGFIFWNYTNSFGYTYPPKTYSRNVFYNLWEDSGVNKADNTIALKSPWSKGTIPAGTKLSQCSDGADYKYQPLGNSVVPSKWTHYSCVYSGTDYSGTNILSKFPPGTAYCKVGFLWNYGNLSSTDQLWITNVSVYEDYKTGIANAQTTANTAKANAATAQTAANKAQTTADEALKGSKENAAQMAQMVTDFNGDIKNLQDQIDGNITTWFYNVDPAMNLPPVTDWDTDKKKDAHLGDIYYNTVKGYAWRFMKSGSTYSWERITDTDVTKALADAAKAQDTADSKRRVFYSTPTVPYDAGDLWVQGSDGDILRCAQAKKSTGSYDRNDWVLASKYTDDSALTTWITGDFATTIQGLEEGLVDAKIETYYQTTDPSTEWPTDKKMEHKGDLWYNSTTSVQKYYRWSGTTWQELTATPPKEVFDSIDNKATIYTGATLPSSPSKGDLWFKGANNPILTYVGNTWVEYNKYTDNTRAEEAYDKAGEAQNTATEAAKTASNYITSSEYGLMVSKNIGEVKETPTTATSRNILITKDNFQIRDGQKVLASYGEDTTIGDLNGGNITVSKNGIELSDGTYKAASIKAISEEEEVKTSVFVFNGQDAENISQTGRMWYATYYLDDVPNKIQSVTASGSSSDISFFNSPGGILYGYMQEGKSITVWVDRSYGDTEKVNWAAYNTLTVVYTKAARTTGVITGEEVYANNVFVRNPKETYVSLLDFIYPVGSIYMSVNSADPGTLIGGTWERIQDTFLLASGSTYGAGSTGGSAKATLPSHTHTFGSGGYQMWAAKNGTGSTEPGNQISGDAKYYAAVKGKSTSNYKWLESVDSKGASDVSQANMPPYLAVYVWKRIS